jgi:hypothetical protein
MGAQPTTIHRRIEMDKTKAVRKMAQDTISALKPGTYVQLSRLSGVGMDSFGQYYVVGNGDTWGGIGHDEAADRLVSMVEEAR